MKLIDYLMMNWNRVYTQDPDGGYVGQIVELPGCLTQGDTLNKCILMMHEALTLWITIALEDGIHIPLPKACSQCLLEQHDCKSCLQSTILVIDTDGNKRTIEFNGRFFIRKEDL